MQSCARRMQSRGRPARECRPSRCSLARRISRLGSEPAFQKAGVVAETSDRALWGQRGGRGSQRKCELSGAPVRPARLVREKHRRCCGRGVTDPDGFVHLSLARARTTEADIARERTGKEVHLLGGGPSLPEPASPSLCGIGRVKRYTVSK